MKKLASGFLVIIVMTGVVNAANLPEISAASAVLMDADSGRVLYSRCADEPRLIASITKLMTALTALESGHDLSERVTIRPEWTGIEGSSLYLKAGEELSFETLLYGLLLRSGNDAAHAVAGYCTGDIDSFVASMNEKAQTIGMENSHFANPSGLNADDHYSTARDMAKLARVCLQNDTLRKIVSTRTITLENRIFTNHNKLLWQYEGCIGMKTGYTDRAGRTLVSAAERDGMTLICVTLNAPNDWNDHKALFDYGFDTYERRCLVKKGEFLCRIPIQGSLVPFSAVRSQEDIYAALTATEKPVLSLSLLNECPFAPLEVDTKLGEAVFLLDGCPLAQTELRTDHPISSNIAPEPTGIFQLFGR